MTAWMHSEAIAQGNRARQEDDYGLFEVPSHLQAGDLLLVLADGMGGQQAGAVASALTVRAFIEAYDLIPATTIPERLERTLQHVNGRLALEVAADPNRLRGMGCTLLAVVLGKEGLYWLSVGDSPLWLWRRGRLRRLNQDHAYRSVLAQQVSAGQITAAEAASHPDRNALISVLTGDHLELVDLSCQALPLKPNDQILLASDGIFTLSEAEIGDILKAVRPPQSPGQALLAAVESRRNPQQDNITVLWAKKPATIADRMLSRSAWINMALLFGILALIAVVSTWWLPY